MGQDDPQMEELLQMEEVGEQPQGLMPQIAQEMSDDQSLAELMGPMGQQQPQQPMGPMGPMGQAVKEKIHAYDSFEKLAAAKAKSNARAKMMKEIEKQMMMYDLYKSGMR